MAFEMALQLKKVGHDVELVVLIDSYLGATDWAVDEADAVLRQLIAREGAALKDVPAEDAERMLECLSSERSCAGAVPAVLLLGRRGLVSGRARDRGARSRMEWGCTGPAGPSDRRRSLFDHERLRG